MDTSGGFDLIPANSDVTAAEVELMQMANRESRLRSSLRLVRKDYDFILLDSPPSLSMLTVNHKQLILFKSKDLIHL